MAKKCHHSRQNTSSSMLLPHLQNFRLIFLSMIRCGFKGINRGARKAVKGSICGMTMLPDVYSNNKFTKIPYLQCCLGECQTCCYKKEKMQLIEKNAKLLASNITCYWSRWVRPNNVETNSKKIPRQNKKSRMKMKKEKIQMVRSKKKKEV